MDKYMEQYTAQMATEAAARGAEWMDAHCPGWESKIDLRLLNMQNPGVCILGQTAECVIGDKRRQPFRPDYFSVLAACPDVSPRDIGFSTPAANWLGQDTMFEMLTIAWRELIIERLRAKEGAIEVPASAD
jgi:hypothetical protein